MTEILFVVLGIAISIIIVLLVVVLRRPKTTEQNNDIAQLLKSDLNELSRTVNVLQESVGEKLERNSMAMQQSVQKQLSESAKIVNDVSQRLTKLDETNRRVVDVADELKTLQNVLQNPKQRGVFGEFYLESVLGNILPTGAYQMQYAFSDGQIADAVIILDKGKLLSIDSKFSLENYNRMVAEKDKDAREKLLAKVRTDLKARIDETSKYIRPSEGTMDFAFMFIPSESLYYDLLVGSVGAGSSARDLVEYAFRDKRVIVVSPTSFMAYLQTVLQGLRSLQIEEQAKDIQVRVGKLGQHIGKFEEYMQKLGNALGTTVNHYNSAHKELGKVDKDIVKIAATKGSVEPLAIEKPQREE